ncbi:MAG: protein-glutamate O-methyltransferase CheR, partial [Acidobacteria bacterium]|nr:protein-glutamate O-methyltransferase CheR [Acidobacteriota bacterium]
MTESVLPLLSDFVAGQMGLHFPPERWRDLERGIGSAAREFGFSDADSFAQWLLTSPLTRNRVEVLASHLTVGETYFFRDRRAFELLEDQILPELIRSRRGTEQRLRIWSAGCATGEEPYSIAILLHKLIADLERWNITLLATDINPRFLHKARSGEYGEWSFRDAPHWLRERYFKKTEGDRFRIAPFIQKLVLFSHLNLAEDAYPSLSNDTNAIDVIFCRNVLMYFTPERQKRVAENFHRTLVD